MNQRYRLTILLAFIALVISPFLFAGNAGAQTYNSDGAVMGADGRWNLPSDLGYCFGADGTNIDYPVSPAGDLSAYYSTYPGCQAATDADVLAITTQAECTAAGFKWAHGAVDGTPNSCKNNWVFADNVYRCLKCHNSVNQRVSARAQMDNYLFTGHRNMVRKVTPGVPLGDVNYTAGVPGALPYSIIDWATGTLTSDGSLVQYIWGGWWKSNVYNPIVTPPLASPSTKTEAGTYACGSCHTTNYSSDPLAPQPEPYASFPGITGVTGTWQFEGVQCERCHKTGTGTSSHNDRVAEGSESTELCMECHTQEVTDFPAVKAGNHGAWKAASIDGHSRTSEFLNSPHAKYEGPETAVGLPDGTIGKYESHFVGGTCYTDSTQTATLSYIRKTDCDLAGGVWVGSTDYVTSNGGCVNCHNVHISAVDPDPLIQKGAIAQRCGINCHTGSTTGRLAAPKQGFHDIMTNPDAPKTNTGYTRNDPTYDDKACVQCHMGDRRTHLFRNSTDANYFEFPSKAQFDAGETTLIPDPNAAGGFVDANGNPAAVSNSIETVCYQCHHDINTCSDPAYNDAAAADLGKAACETAGKYWYATAGKAVAFSSKKAVASGLSAGYHQAVGESVRSFTDSCTTCHADKSTFAQTGHANMLRKVTAGTELFGPNGMSYTDPGFDWVNGTYNGVTLYYIYEGWLSMGNPRTVTEGSSYTCGGCHTTGFTPNCSDGVSTSRAACETAGAVWSPDPNKAPTTDGIPSTEIDLISGSWEKQGIQCERCHGKNTATDSHAIALPADFTAVNSLCAECHQLNSSHDNGFLNSPHARFSGTTAAEISDTTKYDTHFNNSSRKGCTGCHDVHESVVINGAKPFKNECGISCHVYDPTSSSPYAVKVINHPTGVGTPLENGPTKACEVCHMPGGKHLFRINTDPNYTYAISDPTECANAGGTISHGACTVGRTAPEDRGTNPAYAAQWNDLDMTCGQCHGGSAGPGAAKDGVTYLSKTDLANAAPTIHGGQSTGWITAKFSSVSDPSVSNRVRFDAIGTSCPTGATCTYSWDFGGTGTSDLADPVKPAFTYDAPGTYNVKLTVSATGYIDSSVTNPVTASAVNAAPTAGMTVAQNGWDVTVTDTSTDDAALPASSIFIDWGNSTTSTIDPATSATKTYTVAGTYTIKLTVTDAAGLRSTVNRTVTVPVSYTISGTVVNGSGVSLSGVLMYLKQGAATVKIAVTNSTGSYTFTKVSPGTYTVHPVKSGYTFTDQVVTVGPDAVVDFTSTP